MKLNKKKIVILVLLFILISSFYFGYNVNIENFNVESILNKDAGFYSQLFFLLNHYLYCKENKQSFKINSDNWVYKYENGWTDYFKPIELNYNTEEYIQKKHIETVGDYKLSDYQTAINDVYIYNNNTINEIQNIKNKFNLLPYEYDSIYIRRGDKLIDESTIIYEEDYLNLLLSLNPNCKIIFVQTDDYNCVKNLQNVIDNKQYQIKLYTLCDKNNNGSFANKYYIEKLKNSEIVAQENIEYAKTIQISKSIQEMDKNELKEHSLELIVGIDITRYSNICVTDYQSNVGRFIKLSHYKPENVYDVISKENNIDLNKKICPAYSF